MKASNALALMPQVCIGFAVAFLPTSLAVVKKPILLVRPGEVSKIFMNHIWTAFSDMIDKGDATAKDGLIKPTAEGVVLDIGAGHGHTIQYLDPARVTCYIALEPNTHMHAHIRAKANEAGYFESDGRLLILGCGAEDTQHILTSLQLIGLGESHQVDTITSMFTLCCVPDQEKTVGNLVRDVLKPGGKLLYFEHVKNPREDVAWWQAAWTPFWKTLFGGCQLDLTTDQVIANLKTGAGSEGEDGWSVWRESKQWVNEGEEEETLMWRTLGIFTKA